MNLSSADLAFIRQMHSRIILIYSVKHPRTLTVMFTWYLLVLLVFSEDRLYGQFNLQRI